MADTLTVDFTPLPDDYARVNSYLQISQWNTRITLAAFAFIAVTLLDALISTGNTGNAALWAVFLALLLIIPATIYGTPYTVRKNAERNERLTAPVAMELNDFGTAQTTRFGVTTMDWGSFMSLIEMKDYFLLQLTVNKQLYSFIPKRAFASAQQQAEFRDFVTRHIAKKP